MSERPLEMLSVCYAAKVVWWGGQGGGDCAVEGMRGT